VMISPAAVSSAAPTLKWEKSATACSRALRAAAINASEPANDALEERDELSLHLLRRFHDLGMVQRFREDTREHRIEIARQGQHRYGRDVSWGARLGGTQELFTTLSAPVMTRLRQPERQILDTLVDSGVARSRSDALVWAVRLVGQNADAWLGDLRTAMEEVNRLRNQGPDLG